MLRDCLCQQKSRIADPLPALQNQASFTASFYATYNISAKSGLYEITREN